MSRRYRSASRPRQRHFIKEWRTYRGLTQAQLAERLSEHGEEISDATVSRIERGLVPYTQDVLEAVAHALQCSAADLIMRNPLDDDAVWSILDNLKRATPSEQEQIAKVTDALIRRDGTRG